ncbi:hypothetical protein JQX13_44145 [Archangium violaceum]|uniref:hypothetical protein n=1 Tax=Archangium violaceum TaxID=83451 RepID=UPI00193C715F|nr:hypothetical protein [Archangium violaceum]QRK06982.1 hypothetical protein JQX13_44145 [Archangium violaceum]
MNRTRLGPAPLVALAALLLGGCLPGHVTLSIKSPPGTNHGRPLYMIVRTVDPKQYSTESYNDVAAKVISPDESVLQADVIYPGTFQNIKVKVPKAASVAVSFLFTAPNGSWQMLLNEPLPSSVDIELMEGRIQTDMSPGLPSGAEAKPPEAPKMEAPKVEAPKAPGADKK